MSKDSTEESLQQTRKGLKWLKDNIFVPRLLLSLQFCTSDIIILHCMSTQSPAKSCGSLLWHCTESQCSWASTYASKWYPSVSLCTNEKLVINICRTRNVTDRPACQSLWPARPKDMTEVKEKTIRYFQVHTIINKHHFPFTINDIKLMKV